MLASGGQWEGTGGRETDGDVVDVAGSEDVVVLVEGGGRGPELEGGMDESMARGVDEGGVESLEEGRVGRAPERCEDEVGFWGVEEF